MKLLRYGPAGQEKPGMLDDQGGIRDLSALIPDIADQTLLPAGLARLAGIDPNSLPLVTGNPRIGPCVGNVRKFIAIGLNYADHAAESGMAVPDEPVVFNKWTSCIIGPNDDVQIPQGCTKTDWEVELGVVIGIGGSNIPLDKAMEAVAGYCIVNDISERDWQLNHGQTWDKGKGFDTFGPIGPWLVTSDEITDPGNLSMWLEVNGERCQQGSTKTMVFGVAELVTYCSRLMTLMPGDVITTGTPPGVGMGRTPPSYLKGGEVMELGIEGLGQQRQYVRPSAAPCE